MARRKVVRVIYPNVRTELLRNAEIVNECRTIAGRIQNQAQRMNPEADYRLEFYHGKSRNWWGVEDRRPGAMKREAETGAMTRAVGSM